MPRPLAASANGAPAPKYPIESVDNALRMLLMFRQKPMLRVSETARELQISPSTAHRLLAMLLYHGFVRHDPDTRGYVAGRSLIDVGLAVVGEIDIRRRARPHLEQLAKQVGETVHLTALEGSSVVFLDGIESTQALRAAGRTGTHLPAHCTASGKALLAELAPEALVAALGPGRLAALTPRSIVRRQDLERDLAEVRARGYAVNRAESEPELVAVAAAIPIEGRPAEAAIVVTAPAFRADENWVSTTATQLLATAEAIALHEAPH